MRRRGRAILTGLLLATAPAAAQTSTTLVAVEGYGTLEAGGVTAAVTGDSDGDAAATLEWRLAGAPTWASGHPLVRVDDGHFVGALFWLAPGASYEVRVTVSDPDGVNGSPTQTAALATRPDTLPEPTLRTLYVATDGSDSNPGTDPAQPLATLQHAADLAQAGDLILVAPGVYRESVTVTASGTAAQPIVFRGAGPGAVLDGADATIAGGASWAAGGNGVFSRPIDFATGHVVTELGRLFRYDSLAELESLPAGAPGGFLADGSTLRLKLADASSPEVHQVHVAREENGFFLDGVSHVRVESMEIRHFGAGDYGKGVYLRYASDCAVRSCSIHEVGSAGVWVKGGDRNLVEGNQLWDSSIFGWPWDWTKGSSAENNGVALTDAVGRGNVIRRNAFRGTFNGIGPCGSEAPAGALTTETDVSDNSFAEHTDDALEPEGYCANVRMWGNTITDVHMAFAVAPAAPGPTWVVRNVGYDFGATRTSQVDGYLASALKVNSGYPTPIGPLYLYHNTFLTTAPQTSAMALLDPGESTVVVARNNLFAGTDHALYKVNPVTLDWDFDDLHTTHPDHFVWWQGAVYGDLAALRAGTGQETHGLSTPPALADPAGGDFSPTPTSPLVDHGAVIPGVNDGYQGAAPDLGAVELAVAVFADGFEAGTTAAWSATAP